MIEEITIHSNGSITMSETTYKNICLKLGENSPTYLYLLRQKEKNIANAIKYLEEKRIRNKAIVDVDVLEGILNDKI
jgi:glycerol-3-phosphate responsive antiterminator